ncbi:MAG TPA: hydrogenase 2 maturation endopeptidase, partial [Thermoanaerobaculia bacterium]|nr:hydrogenase 2 maturation endopeptidase [Thermoanaerobaculia bacterium]
ASGPALDLAETLLLLDLAGPAPGSVTLIGVEPESVEAGRPMSPAVRAAVPEAVHAVLARLEEIGVGAVPRGGVR